MDKESARNALSIVDADGNIKIEDLESKLHHLMDCI